MIDTRQEPTFAASPGRPAPQRRRSKPAWPLAVTALVLAAVAAWTWHSSPTVQQPAAVPDGNPPPVEAVQPVAPAPRTGALYALPNDAAPRAAAGNEVETALRDAIGADAVSRFLQLADFPRRFVATVDNLGRDHAPVGVWPVVTTPGRFTVQGDGTEPAPIAMENAARYRPFVAFVASLDAARIVDVYRRLYPVLQQSYRALGFGDRSFHDRLIEVADLLLDTPEPAQEPLVARTEVKGPVQPAQPWTQYDFADPALQSLSAGQKMLLRMGPDNRRTLKAKLREIRKLLVQPAPAAR